MLLFWTFYSSIFLYIKIENGYFNLKLYITAVLFLLFINNKYMYVWKY